MYLNRGVPGCQLDRSATSDGMVHSRISAIGSAVKSTELYKASNLVPRSLVQYRKAGAGHKTKYCHRLR